MNPGVFPGISKNGWRDYKVDWKGVVPLGQTPPTVQPSIGNGTLVGRYALSPTGVVIVFISLTFGSTTVAGTGDTGYLFSLPLPFNRFVGSSLVSTGFAILQQDPAGSPSFMRIGSPSYTNQGLSTGINQGEEDYYVQIDGIQTVNAGTGSITNATSTTITHGLGYTPYAWDVLITPTALTAASASPGVLSVQNITSTTFDVVCVTNPGAAKTLSFSWKCDATPGANASEFFSTLVSSAKPWGWATNHSINLQAMYPPRS